MNETANDRIPKIGIWEITSLPSDWDGEMS